MFSEHCNALVFSFQSGLAETLTQGSAYLSSVTEAAATAVSSAATATSSAPAATAAVVTAAAAAQCRHSDSEEDMKEYLPQETDETDEILEAEAAGGSSPRRRRSGSSVGKEVSLLPFHCALYRYSAVYIGGVGLARRPGKQTFRYSWKYHALVKIIFYSGIVPTA